MKAKYGSTYEHARAMSCCLRSAVDVMFVVWVPVDFMFQKKHLLGVTSSSEPVMRLLLLLACSSPCTSSFVVPSAYWGGDGVSMVARPVFVRHPSAVSLTRRDVAESVIVYAGGAILAERVLSAATAWRERHEDVDKRLRRRLPLMDPLPPNHASWPSFAVVNASFTPPPPPGWLPALVAGAAMGAATSPTSKWG